MYKKSGELFTPGIRILWGLLAACCLVYALMVYRVGSGTFSFVIWLAGGVFFGLLFFLAGKGRWGRVPKGLRRTAYVFLALMFGIFAACQAAILSNFFDRGEKDLDYVIVLGAQMRSTGPSVIYRYRLEKAEAYLEKNSGTICITTGGKGNNEIVSEGQGGADYLIKLGIAEERIEAETESRDTVENIKNALTIIEQREGSTENLRIGIVTNGFHVYRGVHIAKKMTDAEICGIAAYMQPQYLPNNLVRESFGIIRDLLKNNLTIF